MDDFCKWTPGPAQSVKGAAGTYVRRFTYTPRDILHACQGALTVLRLRWSHAFPTYELELCTSFA